MLILGAKVLLWLKIDDPFRVSVVHGTCGLWGCWAVGIFCTDRNVVYAGTSTVTVARGPVMCKLVSVNKWFLQAHAL
jgi:ammonia channel protein AmtB